MSRPTGGVWGYLLDERDTTLAYEIIPDREKDKMARTKKAAQQLTTAQQLGSLVKSARDIMRKDKGLNGDLDRLPMLTWIMFLKFLDDMEQIREQEAKMANKKYRPAIEPPYRWRDWAAKEDGITGDALIAFVNNEEAMRPEGKKGPGLFAYLRSLRGANGGDRRDVIATVFKGTINRMINGYLLRDVVNKVGGVPHHSGGHPTPPRGGPPRGGRGQNGKGHHSNPLTNQN